MSYAPLPLPSFLSRDNADGNHSLARSKLQCIEDLSERFPSDEQQNHLLSIISSHLDRQLAPATTAATTKEKAEKEELDKGEEGVADDGEAYEEDAFVQEGGRRAGGEERDIDEDVEEV